MEKLDHVHLSDDGSALVILDQRRLPLHREYLTLTTAQEMFDAIYSLAIRGAPAIGIFAALAMSVLAQKMPGSAPPSTGNSGRPRTSSTPAARRR